MKQQVKYVTKKVGSAKIVEKHRSGRFQVTVFETPFVKTAANPDQRDYVPEIPMSRERCCIQHSVCDKQTNAWTNQQIWCSRSELEDLREALLAFLDGEDVQHDNHHGGGLYA